MKIPASMNFGAESGMEGGMSHLSKGAILLLYKSDKHATCVGKDT